MGSEAILLNVFILRIGRVLMTVLIDNIHGDFSKCWAIFILRQCWSSPGSQKGDQDTH